MSNGPEARDPATLSHDLGVDFVPELLELALTHTSFAYENDCAHNERLEFIGDAILNQAVSVWLYHEFPDADEGDLSKLHHSLVSATALAEIARGIGLGAYLRLGKGEQRTGGRDRDSMLSDALEAVFGAAYLSQGHEVARELVLRLVSPLLAKVEQLGAAHDPKTALQELSDAKRGLPPEYSVESTGPDHDRRFRASVTVRAAKGNHILTRGQGEATSKKAAEMAAALEAWRALGGSSSGQRGPADSKR